MKKFIEVALVLAVLLLTASASFGQSVHPTCALVVGGDGVGASDSNTVLMLRATVTGDCASLEAVQAQSLNLNVEIDDDAAWGAKIQAEFATYRAIVLGDPDCVGGTVPITAAQNNSTTWGPAITGPVALVGTDPEFHFINDAEPQKTTTAQLTQNAIALATSVPGKSGAYISLSCYYADAAANTLVPVLAPFGTFTVQGADLDTSTIVDTGNPLVNTPNALNNIGLSNWHTSTHEAFDSYPDNFSAVVNTNTTPTALPYIISGQTAGTTPTQSQPPQPTGVNATNTFNFDTSTGNQVTHALAFGPDAVVPPGIDPGTLMLQSINKVISNGTADAPIWRQYVVGGPFATSLLFVKSGDNTAFGGTDLGSLYSDLCFDKNHAASDDVCPTSASGINIQDIFDVGGTKPDITPGTTAGMVHFLPSPSNPSETWTASPSSATSNPVCTQTLGAIGGTPPQPPQQCDVSDVKNFILSGDQSGSGGRVTHKGNFATVNNIPMLESLVSANGTPVNTPGVQGTGITWFNTGSLNLDFKVNPGGCPFPFALTTCLASIAANNYFKPAPVSSLTYGVDLLPGAAPSVAAQPPADTSMVQQWDFNKNNPLSLSEGVHVVVWEGIDNVGIQEQNVQLLHPGSPMPCPNPYGLNPAPIYPCYSTTLFTAQIGVDTVPPTITITTPPNGAVYLLNQAVAANYRCTDATSGIASCVGTVANGANVNTASAGGKTLTVTARDNAGNLSTATVSYTVVDQPVNLDVFGTAQSRVRPGATISYFITALNLSQKNVASGVVVTDTVPLGTTVVPGKAFFCKSIFGCFIPSQETPCLVSGPVVTCNIGSLAPLNTGAAVGIIIVVNVPSTTPLNTLLTDTVTATSLNKETDAPDNSVTIKTKVVQSTSE